MLSVLPSREIFIKRRAYWLALIISLGLALLASYQWNAREIEGHARDLATLRARLVFHMIQSTRAWIAGHGGVFAPDSPELAELLKREGDLRIRLTSLRPVNPANTPDAWEAAALQRMEAGAREVIEFNVAGPHPEFRYMGALVVTATCLDCHAHQGYRLGDIRGGIRVSQPAHVLQDSMQRQRRTNVNVHLATFFLVAGLLWFGLAALRKQVLRVEQERDQRQKVAEALADKMAQLEIAQADLVQSEKMASLGRMVAGFAHEVNTPVGIALGAVSQNLESIDRSEALLDHEEVTESDLRAGFALQRETARLALDNLHRAAAMVTSFKRTSVDQSCDQARDFRPRELIEDVILGHRNRFKHTRIQLVARCPETLDAHGPVGPLVQILNNLVDNSYRHAFADGQREGQIEIAATRPDPGTLRIDYLDDGAGMEGEALARLFEPFYTTRRGQGGSGLGMYIVYTLVTQALRGDIECESQPGQGMHCVIRLPLGPAQSNTGPTS